MRGRTPSPPEKRRVFVLQVRLRESEWDHLTRVAKRLGETRSGTVRKLVARVVVPSPSR